MFKKRRSQPAVFISAIANAIGRGLIAGAVGTAAITFSQMIEMKITKRKPSEEPADAAEVLFDIEPQTINAKKRLSNEMHWAYGTSWGLTRGLISLLGLKGFTATSIHFATIYGTALILPTELGVAPPLKNWTAKEILIDALHHAVYAIAVGLVYDAIKED